MVNANSMAAYHCKDRKNNAVSQQKEILEIVAENAETPLTSSEISLKTKVLFAVWKRMPELRTMGYVNNPYSRSCNVTGRKAKVWALSL